MGRSPRIHGRRRYVYTAEVHAGRELQIVQHEVIQERADGVVDCAPSMFSAGESYFIAADKWRDEPIDVFFAATAGGETFDSYMLITRTAYGMHGRQFTVEGGEIIAVTMKEVLGGSIDEN